MDIISDLLLDPLFFIISLLPFKDAARTSLLSRYWRNLWRSTPLNVEFNERLDVTAEEPAARENQRQDFINSVRRFIEVANDQQLNVGKFHLVLFQDSRIIANEGVEFSVGRRVKHLAIDFSDPARNEDKLEVEDEWSDEENNEAETTYVLPENFYALNQVLESLTLLSCKFDIPRLVNCRLLKQISLVWIKLSVTDLQALLANCVVLESLSLKNCWEIDCLDVRGKNLKLRSLVIDRCWFLVIEDHCIEAPNLRYFKYVGACVPLFKVKNTESLEVLDIDFRLDENCHLGLGDVLYDLLYELDPKSTLTVCTYTLQVISMGKDPFGLDPPLSVTGLTLRTAMHDFELLGIKFFLCSCPRLEILDIDIRPGRIFYDEYRPPRYAPNPATMWMGEVVVEPCIIKTLRRVEVRGFKGRPNEMNVLEYLIEYGRVMRNLCVIISRDVNNHGNPEIYDVRARELLGVVRASPYLQITIL